MELGTVIEFISHFGGSVPAKRSWDCTFVRGFHFALLGVWSSDVELFTQFLLLSNIVFLAQGDVSELDGPT